MIPIAVQTVHAQSGNTAPIITPEEGSFIGGQSITVGVTFGYEPSDQGTYTVALYASPTDSCLGPFTAGELVAPVLTLQSGPGPITFTFTTGGSNIFLCANVIDNGLNTPNAPDGLWSGPATYTVSPPISSYINNDESFVEVDLGQSIPLTVSVFGGNAPYSYQWYSVACTAPDGIIVGATSATYVYTPASTGVFYLCVGVTDSSVTPNTDYEQVTVVVNPTLAGSFVIGPCTVTTGSCEFDGQVGSPALTAIVTFASVSGTCAYPIHDPTCVTGTGPWRAVTIFSGTDSLCTGDTKQVAHLDDINGSQAILNFPEPSTPSTTTFYCAQLSDSSMGSSPAYPLVLGPISLGISPALSTPALTLSVTQSDYGVGPTAVTATVTYVGGTAPYTVELFMGSTPKGCSVDDVPVTGTGFVTTPVNPLAPTLASSVTFPITIAADASSTYFCAVVTDSSSPNSVTESPSVLFTVEPLMAVNEPKLSTYTVETLSPYYEGNVMSATVTWSGGTGPYVVELFYGSWDPVSMTCRTTGTWFGSAVGPVPAVAPNGFNPVVDVSGTTATFSFLAPNAPSTYWCYYATVTDSNGNSVTSDDTSSILYVASPIASVTLGFAPLVNTEIDVGQTETVSLVVTWAGGNAPYTVTLYSGIYANCGMDTNVVATNKNIYSPLTTTFSFKAPSATTFYCATVTDSSVPPSLGQSASLEFLEVTPPTVSIAGAPSYEIAAGSGTSLAATAIGGIAPLYYQWFIGTSTCAAADAVTSPSTTGSTYDTGVISHTTVYSVQVTDSSSGTPPVTACATITITVNNGPMGVAAVGAPSTYAGLVYVANPTSPGTQPNADSLSVIDSDSNSVITTIPLVADAGLYDTLNPYAPVTAAGCAVSPWGVTVDSVNNIVYVTGSTQASCLAAPDEGILLAIYVPTNTVLYTYDLGPGTNPEGVAVNPNAIQSTNGEVFIADNAVNSVDVWTLTLATPVGSIPVQSYYWTVPVAVGPGPEGIAIDPTTYTVFVTNNDGASVSVLQPVLNPSLVPKYYDVYSANVGFQPVGVAVNPATDTVYVANSGSGTVSVLNGFTYAVTATIKVGGSPQGIDLDSALGTGYVANSATNALTVINLKTNAIITTVPVLDGPFGVAVDAANGTVFVTDSGTNAVSVVSLATNAVVATTFVP